MKKLISLLLVLAVMLSMLACGDENTTGNDTDGESTADDTTGEDTTGEDTTADDTTGEDTTGEDTTADDTTEGDTTADNTPSDDTTADDTTADDTTAEDTTDVVECTHSWRDATCLTAKTCKLCGETSGSVPGHNYTEATCTKKATCKVCGSTDGKKASHRYDSEKCSIPGDVCSECGKVKSGSTKSHTFNNGICSECGLEWSDYIETNVTIVNPVTGETMTADEVLALLLPKRNIIGTIDVTYGKVIVVADIEVTESGSIRVIFSNDMGYIIEMCEYCGKLPCPDGGDENCREYDVSEDASKCCPNCGRPYGDGFNGTCDTRIDWSTGTFICHHYD